MLDKRYLTLISLASTNSFTQTAKQLFITQPAVSQQMRSLEIELQIPIILREHNKIRLTKAGLELTKFAKQTELESQKIITVLQNDTEHLKMGCTLSLSSTILPKFIQQLTTRSNVVTTKINNTQHILQNIRDGKVDFGLIEGNFNKEEFDSFFVQKENFICAANNQITATSIEDLFNQTLLLREPGSGSRNIFENWLAVQNYRSTDFQSIIEIASPSAIVEFLKHNRGVSFMYESLVSKELKSDQLKKLDLTGFHVEHPINLVFLKNSYFKDTYREIIKSI
ncbi:LysR family transcriptional regulator [Companilactobacillus crustorum]|uniref:LysR family transcriptional regulator n=1 Tax=Companilactobacillus crustorum TaxID=392416 RepID=UPI00237EE0D3|nr:LysR family transcriptional regulator [Companilactobacillus crustorum]WDT65665.1 LysR family transcriptional regulator [Companilactobacillus crustorum]